jgi:peptide/nickel transport system permease protein
LIVPEQEGACMRQYIARRLLQYIPIMLAAAFIIFMIVALVPGDYIDHIAGGNIRYTPEKIAMLKSKYGFDKPVLERFIVWLGNALKGDFGVSLTHHRPVTEVINQFMWNSFCLAFLSFILEILIAVPLGILSATKPHSRLNISISAIAMVGIAMPSFFIGLLLKKVFVLDLRIFPLSGLRTGGARYTGFEAFWDVCIHLFLPVVVLALQGIGSWMLYTRTAMLDVIHQDYIRTARAKGLPERVVIYKHALRNAVIPIVTLLGMSLPSLFTGAMITESVFGIPGVGKAFLDAIHKRDYMFVVGFSLFSAVLLFMGNLLSDIALSLLDPRIQLK